MKNFILISLFLLIAVSVFSQGAYTSQDNKKNNWETAAVWTKQFTWMAAAPPGPADVGGSYVANIYGYVTRNGNLTFSGGSTLNVYDTLVIKGSFTISSSMGVVVHPGGVLIVLGDLKSTSSGGNKITNNGNVVVAGDFSHNGGTMTTNNKIYSFDPTPTFNWGATVDGIAYNGSNTSTMGNQLKSKAALTSANPPLSAFVNSLMGLMPIKLISFAGSVTNNQVLLKWITAEEKNFDHFEIERAVNNLIFEKIAEVKGSGYNTDDQHQYDFIDSNPEMGNSYYRLKSVDLDSSYEYSAIVTIHSEVSKSISVYPNPSSSDFINVSSNFELSENTNVVIFNDEGVMLQQDQLSEQESRVNFRNKLSSGIYVLKYTSAGYSKMVRFSVK